MVENKELTTEESSRGEDAKIQILQKKAAYKKQAAF